MSEAIDIVVKARIQVMLMPGWKGAFYGALSMRLKLVETRDVPRFATDGVSLFFNPEYTMSLSEKERLGLVVHEVLHCALLHFDRLGYRPIDKANIAMDYVVNEQAVKGGFNIPSNLYHDSQYYGLAYEDVYNVLYPPTPPKPEESEPEDGSEDQSEPDQSEPGSKPADDAQEDKEGSEPSDGSEAPSEPGSDASEQSGEGDGSEGEDGSEPGNQAGSAAGNGDGEPSEQLPAIGQGGNGQGGNGQGEPGSEPASEPAGTPSEPGASSDALARSSELGDDAGSVLPAPKPKANEAPLAEQWEEAVRQAAMVAKGRNAGNMPAEIERIIATIEASKEDWREEFRAFVDNRVRTKTTWKRPNRRYATASFVMPGQEQDGIAHLVWLIDSSGSMDESALSVCKAEVLQAWDEKFIQKLTVVCCDTSIKKVWTFEQGESPEFEIHGGGGTRFSPAFEYVANNIEDASAIIYFTDLDCYDFGTEPEAPVLWAIYGQYYVRPVPFGEKLHIKPGLNSRY